MPSPQDKQEAQVQVQNISTSSKNDTFMQLVSDLTKSYPHH